MTATHASTASSGPGWRPRDLWGLVRAVWREFNADRIPAVAAGAAFYTLLALFPALAVFVSLYGLAADVAEAQRHLALLTGILPAGGVTVLGDQMTRLAAAPPGKLGFTFVVSLALSIWSANAGMKAVISGLNVAYEQTERRGFFMLNAVSLAFTAGGILFAMLSLAAVSAVPQVLFRLNLGEWEAASWLRWPAMLVISAGLLSVLYRFAPSHERPRWRWITPGGIFAATGWVAMSLAFSHYVARFGHYDRTYGSLGALAGFMTWIWLSLIVTLAGAELNAGLEEQAARP